MSFKAPKGTGGGDRVAQEVVPIGNYPARLVQIIDLGLQKQRPFQGKEKAPVNMIRTTYELPTEFCVDEDGNEDKEKPRWIGEEMPFYSLEADRAKCTLRYKALDPKLEHDGDWEPLVGVACTLTVVHNPDKKDPKKVYANIGSTAPPMKGFEVPPLVNPTVVWMLDDPDMEVFAKFPEFLQEKIKSNLNFKGSLLEAKLAGKDYVPAADAPAAEGADAEVEENPYG